MKVIREEIAASGRNRLVFAFGRTEIQHLIGLLEKCQRYAPKTPETEQAMNRNRNMLTALSKAIKQDIEIWGTAALQPKE
jgi:hypothetical protein